jgi:tRNA threonylcarbamoyladenosine biosynthesis protein TsaE
VDLYRLKRPEEAWELGLEDAFVDAACLIEWPERLQGLLPQDRLDIVLTAGGKGRRATFTPHGAWREKLATV